MCIENWSLNEGISLSQIDFKNFGFRYCTGVSGHVVYRQLTPDSFAFVSLQFCSELLCVIDYVILFAGCYYSLHSFNLWVVD